MASLQGHALRPGTPQEGCLEALDDLLISVCTHLSICSHQQFEVTACYLAQAPVPDLQSYFAQQSSASTACKTSTCSVLPAFTCVCGKAGSPYLRRGSPCRALPLPHTLHAPALPPSLPLLQQELLSHQSPTVAWCRL